MSDAPFAARKLSFAWSREYPWEFTFRAPGIRQELTSRHRTYAEGVKHVEETLGYLWNS